MAKLLFLGAISRRDMTGLRFSTPLWERREAAISTRKKKRTKIAIFAIIGILMSIFAIINIWFCHVEFAFAKKNDSEEDIKKQLEEVLGDAIDGLDLKELENFLNSLGEEQRAAIGIEDVRSVLRALVSGSSQDFFGRLFEALTKSVGKYFLGFLPSCISIIIICMLKNLLGGLTGDFANPSTTEVVHLICYIAIIIILMSGVGGVAASVTRTVDMLTTLSSAIFPILLTLLSMLGGATSVAAFSPFMAALSTVIMKIVSAVIIPAFLATVILGAVGNLSKTVKLDKLTKLIKSASSWLIGIVFGLFATFLTVQGVAGGVIDRFGISVAKFALSSYVPILGGYLSDGMDLLSASLALTKNALGYTGAAILVGTVAFPILKLAIFSLATRLVAAIAEPLGDGRVASLMSGVASNLSLLVAALAGVAFLFFMLIMLLIGSCNMI